MRTDSYTKAVLTIIAACLVWIGINTMQPVHAQRVPELQLPLELALRQDVDRVSRELS